MSKLFKQIKQLSKKFNVTTVVVEVDIFNDLGEDENSDQINPFEFETFQKITRRKTFNE